MSLSQNLFLKLFFPANSLDTDLRYRPIAAIIKKLSHDEEKILEVGSGPCGLTHYLKRRITGLDKKFAKLISPFLTPVKGSATNIPFPNNYFQITVSVDMLEHLPLNQRTVAIKEMLRVTQKYLLIACPTGQEAQKQDQFLQNYYWKNTRMRDENLAEHLRYRFSSNEEVESSIVKNASALKKRVEIKIQPNTNLIIRHLFMSLHFSSSAIIRKLFWLLFPIAWFWPMLSYGKCYRHIFMVTITD